MQLDRLDRALAAASPVFRAVTPRLSSALGPRWALGCQETLSRLFPDDAALAAAAKGYVRFALETLRAEARFEKVRAYPRKGYAQAFEEVYGNEAYMREQYLPGLLLSHHLWPHHHRQAVFFEDVFLDEVARGGGGPLIDVGTGTGFYARLALARVSSATVRAYDVSRASCTFARGHAAAFGAADRFAVEERDVVARPPEPARWLVSVEVLEHLEEPLAFLRGLRRLLAPGGLGFVTAALNAPHTDHIYLYRTPSEVVEQLEEAGFRIRSSFAARAEKAVPAGTPVAEVAAFLVT
jgi:SAM-dependent methyltransferase